jgi:hypothetical protein
LSGQGDRRRNLFRGRVGFVLGGRDRGLGVLALGKLDIAVGRLGGVIVRRRGLWLHAIFRLRSVKLALVGDLGVVPGGRGRFDTIPCRIPIAFDVVGAEAGIVPPVLVVDGGNGFGGTCLARHLAAGPAGLEGSQIGRARVETVRRPLQQRREHVTQPARSM